MAGLLLGLRRQLAGRRQRERTGNAGVHREARPPGQSPAGVRAGTADMQERSRREAGRPQGGSGGKAECGGGRGAGVLMDMDIQAMQAEEAAGSTCERTQDIVNRDDYLLRQIDEFRDRAQQLQSLMNDREEELRQLEEQRRQEQERRRRQRQQEQLRRAELRLEQEESLGLAEQEEAPEQCPRELHPQERQFLPEPHSLPKDAGTGPQQPAGGFGSTQHPGAGVFESAQHPGTGVFDSQLRRLEQILQEHDEGAADFTSEVERKIDEMIEKVSAKMSELDESVRESVDGGNQISAERARELKESLEQIQEQLTFLKAELSDKVHAENVKCYRNIQALLKQMERRLDDIGELGQKAASMRTFLFVILGLTAFNVISAIVVMLAQFGAFAG